MESTKTPTTTAPTSTNEQGSQTMDVAPANVQDSEHQYAEVDYRIRSAVQELEHRLTNDFNRKLRVVHEHIRDEMEFLVRDGVRVTIDNAKPLPVTDADPFNTPTATKQKTEIRELEKRLLVLQRGATNREEQIKRLQERVAQCSESATENINRIQRREEDVRHLSEENEALRREIMELKMRVRKQEALAKNQ